ncbi:holin [Streptomyces hirsutus]|uniref:holin n=1 Tax=Streptomyces hirsutus TaxID=35620 RepID=UPI00363260EB
MAHGPIETKVKAATAAAYLGASGLLGALAALQDNVRLVEWLPDSLAPFVLALVPAAIAAGTGWKARHTPRPDLDQSGG